MRGGASQTTQVILEEYRTTDMKRRYVMSCGSCSRGCMRSLMIVGRNTKNMTQMF